MRRAVATAARRGNRQHLSQSCVAFARAGGVRHFSAEASPRAPPAWMPAAVGAVGLGAGLGCTGWALNSSTRGQVEPKALVEPAAGEDTSEPAAGKNASGPEYPSPFLYRELVEAVPRRVRSEAYLRRYINAKHAEIVAMQRALRQQLPGGRMSQEDYNAQLERLKHEVELQSQIYVYGVSEPGHRAKYLQEYGCCRWTPRALEVVGKYGPLVEIGAGRGHWQRALEAREVDCKAYDDFSAIPDPELPLVGKVSKGDERQVPRNEGRTLLVVYPDADGMARACLDLYRGNTLLYVGEGLGGVNADAAFFEELERNWEVEAMEPLDPYPECFERLWVLRRRKGAPLPPRRGWLRRLVPWK